MLRVSYIIVASPTEMTSATYHDVLILRSGSAGLSADIFTGRAGLKALPVNDGDPVLWRTLTCRTSRDSLRVSADASC
jgi:hypothetical protein